MLSHGMRRVGVDSRIVEIRAVEGAGGNAGGYREYGKQHHYLTA
jgi:hypothetical protein